MPQSSSTEPLFGRGQYQVAITGVAESAQPFAGVLGQEWEFDDLLFNTGENGPATKRSTAKVRCRLVRNDRGSALLPKAIAKIDPLNAGSVTGLTTNVYEEGYPVDEFLPAAGVPDNAAFWIVVRGNASVVTAATVTADIVAGDYLVPDATTDGAINVFDFTAVPTTAGPFETAWQAAKNARFKATAAHTASGGGGVTILICMTE